MAEIGKTVGTIISGNGGTLGLFIGIVVVFGAPLLDRYVFRPTRLQYRVLYDSKIGLSPEEFYDQRNADHADPQLVQMGELMSQMTMVVIRFRNIGSKAIEAKDFGSTIELTFQRRIIRDMRISEAGRDEREGVVRMDSVRYRVGQSLDFEDSTGRPPPPRTPPPPEPGDAAANETPTALGSLREAARRDIQRRFAKNKPAPREPPPPDEPWRPDRIILKPFRLEKRERFKLVVVLQEPDSNTSTTLSKDVLVNGEIDRRPPKNQKKLNRVSWQNVATATGTLLIGVLLAQLLIASPTPVVTDSSIRCASGPLRITGSSAFAPIIDTIAGVYRRSCPGATITVSATGSINGVHEFTTDQGKDGRDSLGVLSDGKPSVAVSDLVSHAIALIVYSMVVNRDVGLDKLTLAQVQGIYSGQYRDWRQLRPGPSLPIRIVSRGQESGTRATFERKVLAHPEPILSSDSCLAPERAPRAAVIRCERSSTAEQVGQIAAIPGAISYADVPAIATATAQKAAVEAIPLDDHYPDVAAIDAGYPFWTVEYLYTRGVPDNDSVLKNLLDYLSSGNARAELQDAGYTPCITKTGLVLPLCTNEPGS